ncbi:MAG: histidine kinase dimerization/phosphoacceptor domain -containing protein [Flavobacteriaceae bacterium]|nr:tetratricopeptide repeat protein [Flavobacteriaceae bacterium]
MSTNEEKLELLYTQIKKKWFSDEKSINTYAILYDSIASLEKSTLFKARAFNYYGIANYLKGEHDLAIDYYFKAVRILEGSEHYSDLADVYNNLGACYKIRKDFENTEKYYLSALEISEKIGEQTTIAHLWNNLSLLYTENKIYDKADFMLSKAINYYAQTKDSVNLGIAYLNYGNLKINEKEFQQAIFNYKQAKNFVKREQIPLLYAVSQTGIGMALAEKGKMSSAKEHLLEGIEISKEINHHEQLLESYNALAEYYAKNKKFKDAYKLSLESQKLKDSVLSAQQDKNMADALARFETEKIDAQLKLFALEAEKEKQQSRIYLIIASFGVLITVLIGFFLYRSKKRRALLANQKELLEATLEDKNILLKETHHRVKNSLQMVSSLLFLQSRTITDKEAKKAMSDAQSRVRSMAIIHQKLYSEQQLAGVDTKAYFEDLIAEVFNSHTNKSNNAKYKTDIQSILLGIETITLIGLILNELITNVLKHAFKTKSSENLLDVFFKEENNRLVLKVKDNGSGMKTNKKQESLGLKLVDSLSKKLKANVVINSDKAQGTEVILHIEKYDKL